MANIEELDKAIGANGMWKTRLRLAIESGKIDASVETIRVDDQCAFGKWLYGSTVSAQHKLTSSYKTGKVLHAGFHKTAAQVAEFAVAGKKAEAEKMIAVGGEYAKISSQLTQAMIEWKKISK